MKLKGNALRIADIIAKKGGQNISDTFDEMDKEKGTYHHKKKK